MGATAGLSSSAQRIFREQHCWTSQQWHPWTAHSHFQNTFLNPGVRMRHEKDEEIPALSSILYPLSSNNTRSAPNHLWARGGFQT